MAATTKPNVLILGGLNTFSRSLAEYLVPLNGDPLVSHLRIVDKFSVAPATTYLGPDFPKVIAKSEVEYRQANLTVPAIVASSFDPPEGQAAYDYVFDLTGEVRPDRPPEVQINTTFNVARLIGAEAAKRKVKAYVRLQLPFYETSGKGAHDEKVDSEPTGAIGIWWHETLRALAAMDDLNLVIMRIGFGYGPYVDYGIVTTAICVSSVYGYMKKPMKALWSPGKQPNNTVHTDDIAGGLWACAEWMAKEGRKQADALAGEQILFHNEKSKVKEVEGVVPHDKKVVAPLFNLVDDANTTQLSLGNTVCSFFGTSYGFYTFLETTVLKATQLINDDAIEDINEHHVGGWTEMITKSDPPILNSPLSAYMDKYAIDKQTIGFNNAKIKEIVQYKLRRPELGHDNIKEIVDKWKAEKIFPDVVAEQ